MWGSRELTQEWWSPHLSGAKLPVPCIGGMEVIAWQTQSTHVHSMSYLRKEETTENVTFYFTSTPYPTLDLFPPMRFF